MKAPIWMHRGAQGRVVRRVRRQRLGAALRSRTAGVVAAVVGAMAIATLTVFWPVSSSEDSDEPNPLTVAVEQVTKGAPCGVTWIVPWNPDDIDFTDEVGVPSGWDASVDRSEHSASQGGGGPASPLQVFVTVQGTSDAEVTLTRVVPHITRLGPAPAGTLLHRPCREPPTTATAPSGSTGRFRWLDVDLDAPAAPLSSDLREDLASSTGVLEEDVVPIAFPYKVSRSDAETFLIEAHTIACDCEWSLDLLWQSGGETGAVTIDDHSDPFRTIGTSRASATCTQDGACSPVAPRP